MTCFDRSTVSRASNVRALGNGMLLVDMDPDGDIFWLCHVWWCDAGAGRHRFVSDTGNLKASRAGGATLATLRQQQADPYVLKSETIGASTETRRKGALLNGRRRVPVLSLPGPFDERYLPRLWTKAATADTERPPLEGGRSVRRHHFGGTEVRHGSRYPPPYPVGTGAPSSINPSSRRSHHRSAGMSYCSIATLSWMCSG